jgi:hypothetical protein
MPVARRAAAVVLAVAGVGLTVAACGSSSPRHHAGSDRLLARSECMRAHGIPTFPDPLFGPRGWGVSVPLKPGQDPDSPAILKAERACANVGTPLRGV